MIGELGPEARELLIVLLLSFARNDPEFLSEAVLMLGGEERRTDIDMDALQRDLAAFIERFHVASLQDIEIGPMLDGMIRIAASHGIRLPASLALSGKAFGQVQLAIAELDPSLNPFQVVGDFLARNVRDRRANERILKSGGASQCAGGRLQQTLRGGGTGRSPHRARAVTRTDRARW